MKQTPNNPLVKGVMAALVGVIFLMGGHLFFGAIGILEPLGWMALGVALQIILESGIDVLNIFLRDKKNKKTYELRVHPTGETATIPKLIVSDIDGCITPPLRSEIDPYKLAKLKAYCRFAAEHDEYPKICFYTGRNQGYVEFLVQALGITEYRDEIPCVIENGAALYYPKSKTTRILISADQIALLEQAKTCLENHFRNKNEFEIKSFMITINPRDGQDFAGLHKETLDALAATNLGSQLHVTQTASSVDISPIGVSKLAALQEVIKSVLPDEGPDYFTRVMAFGDQPADREVLERVGVPYCPTGSDPQIWNWLDAKTTGHATSEEHIDCVLSAIERECGLKIA